MFTVVFVPPQPFQHFGPHHHPGNNYAPSGQHYPLAVHGSDQHYAWQTATCAQHLNWQALQAALAHGLGFMALARAIHDACKKNSRAKLPEQCFTLLVNTLDFSLRRSLSECPYDKDENKQNWNRAIGQFAKVLSVLDARDISCVGNIIGPLTNLLEQLPFALTPQAIAQSLYHCYALQNSETIRKFFKIIATKIDGAGEFSPQNIGNALYGLKNMSDCEEARAVMAAIAKKIVGAGEFSPQNISNALYGMQNMSDCEEARAVMYAITTKIDGAREFDVQAIGNALYGLKNMSDCEEARAVMAAIAKKINRAGEFNAQAIGNALYGLKNMSDCEEVRAVMTAIATKIDGAGEFNAKAIGSALYGLKNMSDCKEARAVMDAIATKIDGAREFDAQAIGNALYGMQNMSDCKEARAVMDAIATKIDGAGGLSAQAISNALYGLQNMVQSEELISIFTKLRDAISNPLTAKLDGISDQRATTIRLAEAIHSLRHFLHLEEAKSLLTTLSSRLGQNPPLPKWGILLDATERARWIFGQCREQTDNLDLHGYSHQLAKLMVEQALSQPDIRQLVVITGVSSNKPANRYRMATLTMNVALERGWSCGLPRENPGTVVLTAPGHFGHSPPAQAEQAFLPSDSTKIPCSDDEPGPWETLKTTLSRDADFMELAAAIHQCAANRAGSLPPQTVDPLATKIRGAVDNALRTPPLQDTDEAVAWDNAIGDFALVLSELDEGRQQAVDEIIGQLARLIKEPSFTPASRTLGFLLYHSQHLANSESVGALFSAIAEKIPGARPHLVPNASPGDLRGNTAPEAWNALDSALQRGANFMELAAAIRQSRLNGTGPLPSATVERLAEKIGDSMYFALRANPRGNRDMQFALNEAVADFATVLSALSEGDKQDVNHIILQLTALIQDKHFAPTPRTLGSLLHYHTWLRKADLAQRFLNAIAGKTLSAARLARTSKHIIDDPARLLDIGFMPKPKSPPAFPSSALRVNQVR